MIIVKIELVSAIHPSRSKEIGRMYIGNDDTTDGDPARGDYSAAVCRRGTTEPPRPIDPFGPKATRTGSVKGYPRLSYNVWRLITRALLSAFPEENRIVRSIEVPPDPISETESNSEERP
jgi:hypothetical protein